MGLCGSEAKGPGQRRVWPSYTEACRMHRIRGIALNADWSVGAEGQSWIKIVSEQNKLFRNWRVCVDTVFWHVSRMVILMKGRWPIWKKPKDVQGWNRPMEPVRWTRGICFEDADPLALVLSRWELPIKSGGKKETRILQGFWWIGCNILVLFRL